MPLLCLGHHVAFELENKTIHASGSLLFDASGKHWPKCSVLVTAFKHSGDEPSRENGKARKWFGKDYEIKQGSVSIPSRDLSQWTEVGRVERIYYSREGEHEGGFDHQFGSASSIGLSALFNADALSFKSQQPLLYKRGAAYRLELGSGCIVDKRGFVRP